MKILKVFTILMLVLHISNRIAQAEFIFGEPTKVPNINSEFSDGSPQISRDGLELYISSTRDGGIDKIWISKRATIDAPWSIPTKIDAPVNSDSSQSFPSLSADGLELYFSEGQNGELNPNGYGGADIWVLTRASKDDPWNEPKNLGSTINSNYDENTPCISADGLELFFASNLQDKNYGDIMVATRQSKDDPWGEPVYIGPNVNTDMVGEYTPYISTDGLSLSFSKGIYKSHIYVCRRTSTAEPWGPATFVAPVSSEAANAIYFSSPGSAEYSACFADGDSTIYFTRGSNVLATNYNIWQVEVTPILDLNADGIVNPADMYMMLEYWHTNKPRCDIAPIPYGDGMVNVQDLIILTDHLFEDYLKMPHWKLDEESGSTAHDSIGAHDGILHGEPLWHPAGGMIDGALELDGINDYISTYFILDPSLGAFTALVWVKGGANGQVIISQTGIGKTWLGLDAQSGTLMTGLAPPSSGFAAQKPLVSESFISDDQWHHIGFVWDGSYRSLYVDGIEVTKDNVAQKPLTGATGVLYIGTSKAREAGTYFSGMIDDLRVFDVALTSEQIAGLSQ